MISLSNLISPLPFCYRLSAEYEPLTYTTLTFHREGEDLCLHITCFEKNPDPAYMFFLCFGSDFSIQFSCKDTVLPDSRIQLSRDGGENLEGVFWGANLVIPLSLLKEHILSDHQLPFSIRYDRGGVISSPFAGGNTLLNLFCAEKENS